ncbi:MAG: hypothetical protein U1E63_03285 [Burkholderiales bacterium]
MLATLEQHPAPISDAVLARSSHALLLLPKLASMREVKALPAGDVLAGVLERRRLKPGDLADKPVGGTLRKGALACWLSLDATRTVFEQQTLVRRAMQPLLDEKPEALVIAVLGSAEGRHAAALRAVQCAWLNGAELPSRKKKAAEGLAKIVLHGATLEAELQRLAAAAEGSLLCRELTLLPPNELTPGLYRQRIRKLARAHGWEIEEFDLKRLRRLGAGAFVAVAQGSADEDAAIVHLRRRAARRRPHVALVGKGICFDTGGHNLKSAQYMHGMHKDMNGSAVALGLLLAGRAPARIFIAALSAVLLMVLVSPASAEKCLFPGVPESCSGAGCVTDFGRDGDDQAGEDSAFDLGQRRARASARGALRNQRETSAEIGVRVKPQQAQTVAITVSAVLNGVIEGCNEVPTNFGDVSACGRC